MAQYVARTLIAHGKVERGWLGVSIRTLTPELAKSAQAKTLTGVLVVEATKGGPADKAGIKKNDVIIAYRGKEVTGVNEFRNNVAETPIGTEAKITVLRDGRKEELTVRIGSLEESTKLLSISVEERLGIEVRSPNSSEVTKYGLNENQGVVIIKIDPKSPLKRPVLRTGT